MLKQKLSILFSSFTLGTKRNRFICDIWMLYIIIIFNGAIWVMCALRVASFTSSNFHLPCLLNKQSFTPLFAANIAAPERRPCKRKSSFLHPTSTSASSKSSLVLVYKRDLFTFRSFSVIFVFVIALKMYPSNLSLIREKLKQFCKILTGHKFLVDLIICIQFPSQYMSVLHFSTNNSMNVLWKVMSDSRKLAISE